MGKKKSTFRQRVIAANSAMNADPTVNGLTTAQIQWADENALDCVAYYRKNKAWQFGKYRCMSCGMEFDYREGQSETDGSGHLTHCTCPHCHSHLKVEFSRATTYDNYFQFAVPQVYNGMQVLRVFETRHYCNCNWNIHSNL